jgi:hypothetical protein
MIELKEAKIVGYYYSYLNHNLYKMDHTCTALTIKRLYLLSYAALSTAMSTYSDNAVSILSLI